MTAPKYFKFEQLGDTFIFIAIDAIGGLVENEARVEWDCLLDNAMEKGMKNAIIDLHALDYFGGIVLEFMTVLWKRISHTSGKVAICQVSDVGLEILSTANYDKVFQIYPTRDQAIEAVSQ